MKMYTREKKDEEASAANPYQVLDKTTVLQEARMFNETPINARKCCHALTKLLYMLGQGETLGRTEATEAFFAVTKLWQSKDATLRRLVYLAIKELCEMADDVIIVTSSLTKDMTGREDQYRAAAIRALCKITDSSMLQAIERYMKQAIVDKGPAVSSAALVSSLHLLKRSPEVVRRWVNEVQEAVNSDNHMVQFHALAVLYNIRNTDRLAVNKLVQKFSKQGLKSPYALCYLIRLARKLIEDDDAGAPQPSPSTEGGDRFVVHAVIAKWDPQEGQTYYLVGENRPDSPLFDFLESCLRHKCEVVIYEAASAIVRLPHVTSKELAPAISVLQLFCSSPKPSLRFAAVRTLNKISISHPQAVAACNMDLEQLITDQNRSIATLAITTLLKTGAESSVERLMKQISSFVSEISDEFKIVVIEAIRSLCMRYPRKHAVMMNFLATMLRDDGGYDYKKSIVDTIITIIEENPDAKETGFGHLCEFIEDCEHAVLATRILHLLGREGPKTQNPRRYIRFVYNRVILEQPQVRAAAVTALAKFGAQCPDLQPSICVLLNRCLLDTDDEVRDRATYYVNMLQEHPELCNKYIMNGLQVSVVGLERALQQYCEDGPHDEPFDLKIVPVSAQPITVIEEKRPNVAPEAPTPAAKKEEKAKASRQDVYAEQLRAIPEYAELGPLFRSSEPTELTESETEYVVHCVKHTFMEHILFEFDCRNTLNDQLLENVMVTVEPDSEGWEVISQLPCPELPYSELRTTYTLVKMPEDPLAATGNFGCTMKFIVKDCDPNTGIPEGDDGYQDEYVLEEVEVCVAEHVQRVIKTNFAALWNEIGEQNQLEDTYALTNVQTIQEAIKNLIKYVGLGVCERSDKVPEGKSSHTLLLSGVYRGGEDVLVRGKFALNPNDGSVTMNLAIRSPDSDVAQLIAAAVG